MRLNSGKYFQNFDQKILQQRLINSIKFKNDINVGEMKTNL